jgi:hypothetical protein
MVDRRRKHTNGIISPHSHEPYHLAAHPSEEVSHPIREMIHLFIFFILVDFFKELPTCFHKPFLLGSVALYKRIRFTYDYQCIDT